MELMESWQKKARDIEAALKELLVFQNENPSRLYESVRYSTLNGGKRFRGFLVCCAAEISGGEYRAALQLAAAIEMIHAYSLIHDDLPCMDDDDMRRGRPSNHKVYGEAMALLAGDALLTHAFLSLAGLSGKGLPPEKTVIIIKEIAEAIGMEGMIGGQALDIMSEGKTLNIEELAAIHRKKTGMLICASIRTGALLGTPSEQELEIITKYAQKIGLAFQITDDILNETGNPEILGKPVKNDERNKKATYPSIFGLKKSIELAGKEIDEARQIAAGLGKKAGIFIELADYILMRNK